MDNRKKGVLLLMIGGLVLFVCIMAALAALGRREKAPGQAEAASVTIDIPEGEVEQVPDSKSDVYNQQGRSSIDDYWDSIGEDIPDDDPLAEMTGNDSQGGGSAKISVDDMFSHDDAPAAAQQPEYTAPVYTREQRMADYQAQRQQIVADVMAQQAASQAAQDSPAPEVLPEAVVPVAEEEPEERIDISEVKVKRSGSVSSLEGGVSSLDGTGVSSLGTDEDIFVDESYPFKCMFVRQEKLRSGSRVAVRLLEDMVIDGTLVPRNTHLMATCQIGGRIQLNIASIEIGGRIISLNYDAYDNDGTKGIYCSDVDDEKARQTAQQGRQIGRAALRSNVGRIGSDILQMGQVVLQSTGGEKSVTIPEGYQFYIVRSKNR